MAACWSCRSRKATRFERANAGRHDGQLPGGLRPSSLIRALGCFEMSHSLQLLLLLVLAIAAAKLAGTLAAKIGQPAVFGEILAGLMLGPTVLNVLGWQVFTPTSAPGAVSYTHLRAHETPEHLVCRLLLEKKKL